MTLPAIATIQVATQPLPAFLARQAAILAAAGTATPLPEINFAEATVLVGDGNGAQPSISTLQNSGALVHQVWSGQIVQSVSVDAQNAAQVDILCVIPAVDSTGAEIGPFWMTEFIITDENAVPMIAGVTLAPKLVTANGATTDLAFIGAVGFSLGTVVLQAPSAAFLSAAQAEAMINGAQPTCVAPLAATDTTDQGGWLRRVFSIAAATMAAVGVGRPATNAEFAAGAPAAAPAYQYPWPTVQQVAAALTVVTNLIPGAATAAQVIAGVLANVWVSPAALIGALSGATLGSALLDALQAALGVLWPGGSQWQTLPGGYIVQWGSASISSGNGDIVTLPTAFPHNLGLVISSDGGNGCHSTGWQPNGASLATFKAYGMPPNGTSSYGATNYVFIAFGW